MKVFIDTNIVIDFLSGRPSYLQEAEAIFQLADSKEIDLIVSDLTIVNTVYILQKLRYALSDIYDSIDRIKYLFKIVSVGNTIVNKCLNLRSKDFEDSIQYYSAQKAGADILVTNNKKDFTFTGTVTVVSSKEFLEKMNIEVE